MQKFGWALFFIGLSRAAVAVSSVLNISQMLRHVSDEFRGRVFSTIESMVWSTMMISMMLAGIASQYYEPAHDRRLGGRAQLDDGDLLGLGELDRPAARADAGKASIRKRWRCMVSRLSELKAKSSW